MTTLYSFQGKIFSRNTVVDYVRKIKIGEPLTCEYKTISIVSNKFDRFGKSQIMIVNNVKNKATKDRIVQSITYYDQKAKPKKDRKLTSNGRYKITVFDASQYGYPVCFYTPGYQGTEITITTNIWEVDDNTEIKLVLNLLSSGLTSLASLAGIPYLTLASDAISIGQKVLVKDVDHTELNDNHTFKLSCNDEDNLYLGYYICIPELDDINIKNDIIKNYMLVENGLYKLVDGKFIEYDQTYFVIYINNQNRKDLTDFDYEATNADLMSMLTSNKTNYNELTDKITNMSKDAYNMGLVQLIKNNYDNYLKTNDESIKAQVIALYNQLVSSSKDVLDWFDKSFPEIKKLIE